jgi:hypothetical protein
MRIKSRQQKLIYDLYGAINTLSDKIDDNQLCVSLTDKDNQYIKDGYDALQELEEHENRKVGTRYKGVSKNQWKKWNADEREMFNLINKLIRPMQNVINPATAEDSDDRLPKQLWNGIVHNIAFLVADEMKKIRKQEQTK